MRPIVYLILFSCLAASNVHAGQLAVIIDDIGYNAKLGRRSADLDGQFTLAILPFTPHATEIAERAHTRGKEIILHAPMSNIRDMPLGEGALRSKMTHSAFSSAVATMIADIPHIKGVNNHMGSQLTREQQPMDWLMRELAQRGLYFVDSRTSADSLALEIAQQHHIPSTKRDIFLDNQRDTKTIRIQLRKALALAKARGWATAIGHPYPETLQVLEKIQPLLDEYQVELVCISRLLDSLPNKVSPTPLRHCPAPPLLLWRPLAAGVPLDNQPLSLDLTDFSYEP